MLFVLGKWVGVLNARIHCKLRLLTVKHFSSSAPLNGMFGVMQML